jgi:hypothetical protein
MDDFRARHVLTNYFNRLTLIFFVQFDVAAVLATEDTDSVASVDIFFGYADLSRGN